MEENKDSPPRLFVQRPSISAAHSWPRLPALALTNSNEEVELNIDSNDDEENNNRRHKKKLNNDDNLSTVSTNSEESYLTQNEEDIDIKDKEDDNNNISTHPRRPSTIQQPSADTLVEAALTQPEVQDRHVRFQDHVLTSAAIVQQMLNQTSGNTDSTQLPPMANNSNHNVDITDDDLRKMESYHSPPSSIQPTGNVGSVLGSLMRLDAQRRRREDEYLREQQLKKEKKLKAKKKEKKEKKPKKSSKKRHSMNLDELDEKLDSLYTNDKLSVSYQDLSKTTPQRPKMNRPGSWLSTMSSSHVVPKLETKKKTNKAMSRRSSIDSMVTTASQFEPITLEDRVRITFEIANILQKQELLKKLARALMLYGCPAHRLELAMRLASKTLGVDAEYIYLPNMMLLSFFDATTHTTETHFIRQMQFFDMDRLSEVYRLEKLICHGEVSVDEALEFIDQVSSKPPLYPAWWNSWIYAICAFSGCVMFFGGRWQEGGVAAVLASKFILNSFFDIYIYTCVQLLNFVYFFLFLRISFFLFFFFSFFFSVLCSL
ncbi:unnamed protein product [Cunninghamella echinulata]